MNLKKELHDIYQFLLLRDHMMDFVSVDCLDVSCEFRQGSGRRIVKQNRVYCVIWSAFLLVLSVLCCV